MTNTNAELAAALRWQLDRFSDSDVLTLSQTEARIVIAALEATEGKAEAWDEGNEHGWEAAQVAGEVYATDESPNPYRNAS